MIAYGLWCYVTQSPRSFELLQGPEVEALVYLYSSSRNPSRPLPHFVCTMAQRLGASAKARARANNDQDRGWAPLRADAPGRLPRRRGSFPDLDTAEARASAVEDLRKDVYAASSIPGVTSRMRFFRKALRRWNQSPWPITVEKIERVGAALKKGKYASPDAYLSQYRVSTEHRGYDISGPSPSLMGACPAVSWCLPATQADRRRLGSNAHITANASARSRLFAPHVP